MEDSKTAYSLPEGFDPYASIDAIRGLVDAIHHFMLEGPGTAREIPFGDKAGLNALLDLVQPEVHALQDYLHELDNRGLVELPTSDEDFNGVKEPRLLYGVK